MEYAVVGLTHKEASVEARDMVAFTPSKKIEATRKLLDLGIDEIVILSTCNRSEVYIAAKEIDCAADLTCDFILDFFNARQLRDVFFVKTGNTAISYLLSVTTGLDSLILGEDQILGQVKDALEWSIELGSSKKYLNRLFTESITFAKRMKTVYKISENPLSLSSVAVKFLVKHLGSLADKKIFVIGTGEMGQLTMRYLFEAGSKRLFICNRTGCLPENMGDVQGEMILYDERYSVLEDMDIVISATSSPHMVLKAEHFPVLKKNILLMDMAMPMDIDRKIAQMPGVSLFDIDDLDEMTAQSMDYRRQAAEAVEGEIILAVSQIQDWVHQTRVDPIIESFHEICKESLEDTMDLIKKKIDLNARELVYLEKLVDSAIRRVVREPIRQLKQLDSEEEIHRYKEMIHKLFDF